MQHISMTTLDYDCNRDLIMSSKQAHHNLDAEEVGLQRLYAPSVPLGPSSC